MNTATLTNIFRTRGTDIWTRTQDLSIMLDYERPKLSKLIMDTLNSVINAGHSGVFQKITITVIIDCTDPDEAEPDSELCLHLPNSQMLRILRLEQVDLSLKHLAYVFSLPLLQELESSNVFIIVPNLVRLSLDGCEFLASQCPPVTHPERSILLSKLEKLSLQNAQSLYLMNILFQALEMPNLRKLKFGAGPSTWNHTLEKLQPAGFTPEIMEDLVKHVDKLDNPKRLEILPDDFRERIDFPFEFANKLLDTSCCPMLQEVQLPWNRQIDPYSWEALRDFKAERPSLHIYLDMEELECSEEDVADEDDSEERHSEEGSVTEK
ncbi:hypothetical protein FRC06_007676, partial [Ceratobasidium sp. 370]